MSIFELTFFISALAGLVMGGVAGRPFGILGVILGVIGGFVVGLSCHFIVLLLSTGLAKIGDSASHPPKNRLLLIPWRIANLASVMLMILSPLGTIGILAWVTALLKK